MKAMSKKVEKEQAKEQKCLAILLRTMVNGYMLEVNNEGYMYFNAQSLLEGFMVHVGLERLESMTKEEIKDMLNSLKDGSAVNLNKNKDMAKEIRITSVRNAHGCKIKKCCASCQHKCIESDGTRVCASMMLKVQQKFKCKKWQMSDGLKNAGKGGGVVRNIETKEIVIR